MMRIQVNDADIREARGRVLYFEVRGHVVRVNKYSVLIDVGRRRMSFPKADTWQVWVRPLSRMGWVWIHLPEGYRAPKFGLEFK